jgi:hypothetical protein
VLFSREWRAVGWRAGGAEGPGGDEEVFEAPAPRGPERLTVIVRGWVELRSVRVRGVLDPDWRREARKRSLAAMRDAAERSRAEPDLVRRAAGILATSAAFPALRREGLALEREAARLFLEAGDRARAASALRSAAWSHAEDPAGAAECLREAAETAGE